MAKSGLNLDEFALHALLIFGATTRAAGGDTSKRVRQKGGEVEIQRDQGVHGRKHTTLGKGVAQGSDGKGSEG